MFTVKKTAPRLIPVALVMMLNLASGLAGVENPPRADSDGRKVSRTGTGLTSPGDFREQRSSYQRQALILPRRFELEQNWPNPFNQATTIGYTVSMSDRPVKVIIEVFDAGGECVRTLVDEIHEPGQYSFFWQGTDDKGGELDSGTYFYRLRAGKYMAARKMVIGK
ncbi:MAG: hypothetical protein FVQ81_16485 [Candidatus Glassbacteria bacterium]|nr:hypothetical protein [Candidatus Glassbacteria bacterium]